MDPQEAIKALQLAQKHDAAGNTEAALKWVRKSIAISPSPAAQQLLERLEKGGSAGASSSTASTSADGLRNRTNGTAANAAGASKSKPAPAEKRSYTVEQVTVVKRVRSAGGDFYKVLEVEKTAEDNVIKKAYRKLALQLHPDKNGAPGADEAFKIVSKAFTVLSDSDKRAAYDRFGGDPDSRFGAASAAAGGRDPRFQAGGMNEVDPQELFNMFFGGGGMGGRGATFQFGGPGMQFRSFGGAHPAHQRRTRQQQQAQTPENSNVLLQFLPLLILALFSLLSYAPAFFTTSDPGYSFSPSGPYRENRFTPANGVSYYVDKNSFRQHPFVTGESKSNGGLAGFERRVETRWKNALYDQCQQIREYQLRRLQNTQGFFGIGSDPEAAARIRAERHEPCERLQDFGISITL